MVLATLLLAGCASAPATSFSPTRTPTPTQAPTPSVSASASQAVPSDGEPSTGACSLDPAATDWAAVPAGRCVVPGFRPEMSFTTDGGWYWGGSGDLWALSPTYPANSMIRVYRYGGSVVPAHCKDPQPTVVAPTPSDIIEWLDDVEGLEVTSTALSIHGAPAWRLDLAVVAAPTCPGPGLPPKDGLMTFWTIDTPPVNHVGGLPVYEVESLGQGESTRIYLIELPAETLVAVLEHREAVEIPGPSFDEFIARADALVGGFQFP